LSFPGSGKKTKPGNPIPAKVIAQFFLRFPWPIRTLPSCVRWPFSSSNEADTIGSFVAISGEPRCKVKLSFIIPLYNCLPLTRAMLVSLQSTMPAGLSHEIILVDDGSTDGTREWLQSLPPSCRVLLNEQNLGFAGTCNRGAAIAAGELLFFLNNDLEFLPRWLEPMLAVFDRCPRAGAVGNVQLNFATGAIDHTGIFFDDKGKPAHDTWRGFTGCREVDAVTGACLGIRGTTWRQLGGFDEGYRNGCEDVDLCLRARVAGFNNYIALRSTVRHHISASTGRKLRDEQNTARLHGRWRQAIIPRILTGCCRVCLAAAWEEPRNYPDPALARDAFLYFCRLLPFPSAALLAAAAALLDVEQARWAHLFDGIPLPPERETAWQFFPIVPEDPPVL
jgi:GT2 family glycosyltransferase